MLIFYAEDSMSDFYTRIKAYREKLNLNQKKRAENVGVRRETIVRLEKGQHKDGEEWICWGIWRRI